MTTATSTFPSDAGLGNTAGWQTLVDAIHNVLVAAGWVQTSDTGQLLTSAITYNATPGVAIGYRIYKWSDALSGTLGSLYAKVTYTCHCSSIGNGVVYKPAPKIEVSMGTDGAGNLSSPSAQVSDVDSGAVNTGYTASTRRANYASYSVANNYSIAILAANRATWSPSYNNRLYPTAIPAMCIALLLLAVRRLTDKNGAAVAGFSVLSTSNQPHQQNGSFCQRLASTRITATGADVWGWEMFNNVAAYKQLVPSSLTPAVQLTNPFVVSSDGALLPFPEFAFYSGSGTLTLDASFTNNVAGTDRTFRALGDCGFYQLLPDCQATQATSNYEYLQVDARSCVAIRWE